MTTQYGTIYRNFLQNQADTGTHGMRKEMPWDNSTAFPESGRPKGELPETDEGAGFTPRAATVSHGGPTQE